MLLAGNVASVEVMRHVGVVCSFLFNGEDFERSEPTLFCIQVDFSFEKDYLSVFKSNSNCLLNVCSMFCTLALHPCTAVRVFKLMGSVQGV